MTKRKKVDTQPSFFAMQRRINKTWFLQYRLVGGNKIEILGHWNMYSDDPERPNTGSTFSIVEDEGRVAKEIRLDTGSGEITTMQVSNPDHVFGYGDRKP